MISSLQNLLRTVSSHRAAPAATAQASRSAGGRKGASPEFSNLLRDPGTGSATTKIVTGTKTTTADLPHLGPMTADPGTHPAAPPPKPPAPVTSSPYLPAGFQGDVNLMNRAEHVNTMNAWLESYTKWSNDNRTQVYQQAMYNWQLNSEHCQELGIEPPPKPTPPTLDPIQNMPMEYWFR
jgi:hypothetical protein